MSRETRIMSDKVCQHYGPNWHESDHINCLDLQQSRRMLCVARVD